MLSRIPHGVRWMLASYLFGAVFQGAYFLLLARYLGPSQYGIFAGSLALVTIFTSFAGIGSAYVMVMNTAREPSTYTGHLGTALLYTIISALPLGIVAAAIGFNSGRQLGYVVAILAASELVFNSIIELGYQSFQAHDRLKGTATYSIAAGVIRLAALVIAHTIVIHDLTAIKWACTYALVNVVISVTILIVCMRNFGFPRISTESIRSAWRVGMYFALGTASRNVYADSDKFFLARYEVGGSSTGTYAAGSKIASFACLPIQAIAYANSTRFFRVGARGYRALWTEMRLLSIVVASYACVATVAIVYLSGYVVILLGPEYEDTVKVLRYLCVLPLFQGVNYLFGDALMGVGNQAARSIAQALIAGLAVGANMILIPRLGWPGAAIATVGCSALLSVLLTSIFFAGVLRESRRDGNNRGYVGGEKP